MPKARSLHVGLNAVSGAAYNGWEGKLAGCEFDANDMADIAKARGMESVVLLTKQATRAAVLGALADAAKALTAGDLFFLSYSGHGGQMFDINGDETDKQDETWILYDGQLIDDEFYAALAAFSDGVRVLVLSDSCHSGTVTRQAPPSVAAAGAADAPRWRLIPADVAERNYRDHKEFYNNLQRAAAGAAGREAAQAGVNGWNVTSVNIGTGGRRLGQYRMDRPKHWVETNAAGAVTFNFDETGRDEWSVYLVDRSRNVNLQLDLWRHMVVYSDPNHKFDLYIIAPGPSILLISGCADNQLSGDGGRNGTFTARLRQVWNEGNFNGDYTLFHKQILAGMPASQSPNLFTLGPTGTFVIQAPFSV